MFHCIRFFVEPEEHEIEDCGQGYQVSVPEIKLEIDLKKHIKDRSKAWSSGQSRDFSLLFINCCFGNSLTGEHFRFLQ